MSAPVIPVGAKRFKNISIEVGHLDAELFVKTSDQRKRLHNARQRQFVLGKFASRADADGSNCYPSIKTLADESKMSVRQFTYYTADLVEMGFIINLGYRWENGPRDRLLVIPAPKSGTQDSAGTQDSDEGQERKIGKQERNIEERERKIGKQERNSYCVQPASSLPASFSPASPTRQSAGHGAAESLNSKSDSLPEQPPRLPGGTNVDDIAGHRWALLREPDAKLSQMRCCASWLEESGATAETVDTWIARGPNKLKWAEYWTENFRLRDLLISGDLTDEMAIATESELEDRRCPSHFIEEWAAQGIRTRKSAARQVPAAA